VPEDTLLLAPPRGEDKPRYTTIDRHFAAMQDTAKDAAAEDRARLSSESLGGLHPDEVFYANDDLLILKGGGFPVDRNYPRRDNAITDTDAAKKRAKKRKSALKRNPSNSLANFLATKSDEVVLRRLPRSSEESPEHLEGFASSRAFPTVVRAPRGASQTSGAAAAPNKVLHYHYHSAGNGAKPFVDYSIHRDGTLVHGGTHARSNSQSRQQQPNRRQLSQDRETHQFRPSQRLPANTQSSHSQQDSSFEEFPPSPPQPRAVSLHRDTHVNFLPPLPSVDPGAETLFHRRVPKSISQNRRRVLL